MKTDDFDYYLPEELIAQTPLKKRDSSRMLVLDKQNGNIFHKTFSDIIDYLNPGDTLVLNDTKVIPARIIGVKEDFETEEGKELLEEWNVSDNYIGVGYCILGYFNEEYFKPKSRKEADITIIK